MDLLNSICKGINSEILQYGLRENVSPLKTHLHSAEYQSNR